MKLSKALKVKNRLVGEMNRLRNIFSRENSRVKNTSKVNLSIVEKEMLSTMKQLILIKTAITKANVGIYEKICHMEELKSLKAFYSNLKTTNGEVKDTYSENNSVTVYEAYLNQEDIDNLQKEWQQSIDKLQDDIDEYNATTTVEIENDFTR